MAARIACAIRSALFRGEGGPSPHPYPAALRAASASRRTRDFLHSLTGAAPPRGGRHESHPLSSLPPTAHDGASEPSAPERRRRTPGAIRKMFESVAPGYDRMNRVLSLGLDQGWRRAAVAGLDLAPGSRVLDLCCGTGDLALLLPRGTRPVGCDFTPAMLAIARLKARRRGKMLRLVAGDALRLPFGSGVFAAAVVGFGIRNLPDLEPAFREIRRVLAPGAQLVILEFSRPKGRFVRIGHRAFLRSAVPRLARLAPSGAEPYDYLKDSILDFPEPGDLARRLRKNGFAAVSFRRLALGTVAVHRGRRPA